MTSNTLHPDDPRLTAYALGELDVAERATIERELSLRPELRAEVEQVQQTAALLGRAFEHEPAPAEVSSSGTESKRPRRVLRRWMVATCGTLAAAAAAIMLLFPALQPSQMDRSASYYAEAETVAEAAEELGEVTYVSRNQQSRPESVYQSEFSPGGGAARYPDGNVSKSATARHPTSLSRRTPTDAEAGKDPKQWYYDEAAPAGLPGEPASGTPLAYRKRGSASGPANSGAEAADYDGDGLAEKSRIALGVEFKPDAAPAAKPEIERLEQLVFSEKETPAVRTDASNESYNAITENPFIPPVGEQALSTFSIDVDTASYSNVRRFLRHGQLPPPDAVRIEELVNYFDYDYPQPPDGVPFSVATEVAACPWEPAHRLVRIGLKGREIEREQRPVSNLVFLLDVSGSMQDANKLPLVKAGMELLLEQLNENDRISIVTYAGNAGLVLEPTSGDDKDRILSAIRSLQAGGSTNGEAGIRLAYTQAIRNFTETGSNRVILCTDGDFNVGVSSDDELVAMIQEKAKQSRVFLSIFGFGMGNLKDAKLEQLANKGNGHYGYIDDLREARKVFSEELMGTLYTIAKDVKIQVEFNPQQVGAYRLIGYENRALAARDFTDDTKDAGEIGAGHTVTALYEVVPAGQVPPPQPIELKYQRSEVKGQSSEAAPAEGGDTFGKELLTVKLRYKLPDAETSVPLEFPLVDHPDKSLRSSPDFDWAAAVAAFGMILRNSQHKGQADLTLVRELAQGGLGGEPSEHRREFLELVDVAERRLNPAGRQNNSGTDR